MIRTKKLHGGAQVKLTFTLPAGAGPDGVSGLGDFTHWNQPVPLPPARMIDGSVAARRLPAAVRGRRPGARPVGPATSADEPRARDVGRVGAAAMAPALCPTLRH